MGLHQYRFQRFEKVEQWVQLCLVAFLYLEWYRAEKLARRSLPAGATLLLGGRSDLTTQPVAWVRTGRRGRVFSTSLGRPADFGQAGFVRLLCNAIGWVAQ